MLDTAGSVTINDCGRIQPQVPTPLALDVLRPRLPMLLASTRPRQLLPPLWQVLALNLIWVHIATRTRRWSSIFWRYFNHYPAS